MGLSWSNTRRRTTTFYHPPPPPPPCCYHHHAEPISLLPPPPPPHQSHYTTMHQPQPSQSYPPPNNPYPTHIPPPVHHYRNSQHYHSCNYANHQPFYYTCHHQPTSGWSPVIRPHVGFASTINAATAQPILPEPAPFVDHQNAKRVRNDVNVNKDTLKVEIDVSNPDHHLVSFVFDALFDGRLVFDLLVLDSWFYCWILDFALLKERFLIHWLLVTWFLIEGFASVAKLTWRICLLKKISQDSIL